MCSVTALRWSVRGTEASQPVLPPELTALGRTGQTWRVLGHGSKGVWGTDTEWALTVGRRQVRSPRPPACLSPKGVGTGCEAVSGLFEGQRPVPVQLTARVSWAPGDVSSTRCSVAVRTTRCRPHAEQGRGGSYGSTSR